jgi:uncharacterized protein (TIGR02145 family)
MAENLKVIHYRNGDPIPNMSDNKEWGLSYKGAYCNYNNDESNFLIYGRLYNWLVIDDSRNIAPIGWHVSTDSEWFQLGLDIGFENIGYKLKESGISHWSIPNKGATNETGFTALPGGCRDAFDAPYGSDNKYGLFYAIGGIGYWWSIGQYEMFTARCRFILSEESDLEWTNRDQNDGLSIRCVKD